MTSPRRLACALLAPMLTAAAVRPASAQSGTPTCSVSPAVLSGADACQKAQDLFAFVVPQIGVAVSGGNPLPGDAGTLGGFGKRAISLRVVAVEGRLPKNSVPISVIPPNTRRSSDFGAARTIVPIPAVDLAIGLFPGLPLGVTNVGGVDLLVGATLLPSVSQNAFDVSPRNGGVGLAYGLRVGALQESSFVPGVSLSWQRRTTPTTDFRYAVDNDTLSVTGTTVRADAFRLVASKRLALFGLAVGVGRDRIEGESRLDATVNETAGGVPQRATVTLSGLRETASRNTAFANASFSVLLFRIVGEFGWSSAGTIRETVNTFGGRRANEGYRYGSLGLTARF